MNNMLIAAALSLAWATTAVHAAEEPKKELTGQQLRMKNCNAEAKTKELKGDERKAFMKACLSGGKAAAGAAKTASKN